MGTNTLENSQNLNQEQPGACFYKISLYVTDEDHWYININANTTTLKQKNMICSY